jgi:retinol-binding protein 3
MKRLSLKMTGLVLIAALLAATSVWAQGNRPEPLALDDELRSAIVDSVLSAVDEIYVFPEVAAEMGALVRKNLEKGKYDEYSNVADFAGRLTEDFQSISHDLHLHVDWQPPRPQREGQELSDEEMQARYMARNRENNFGFREVKLLPGNVAYIKLDQFAGASEGGPTAIAAMNFVGYADAIIFDLRENGGGSPSMIQLLTSYLVDESTHLNDFYIRQSGETDQFWTHAWVPGPRMPEAEVYVLTSRYTFSAAEEFTYNLKNMERATIVGQTTGGGAHPVNRHEFPALQLSMSLPFGRAINPITGTNWEGAGIEPHLVVPVETALDVAYLDALKKQEKAADEEHKVALEWIIKGLDVQANPILMTEAELEPFTGQYGPRKVWIEDGGLWYQRGENAKFQMTPMGEGRFLFKDLDYFRIEFEQAGESPATNLIGHYRGGRMDQNSRSGS